ncbi:DUF502 domain-containing protein [Rufibacter glacialis]|uniref:DUF502 domain-containing protein n=1 Tax=Rufibacter glacialis TaxID=1259555 RepID=A0A5M8QKT6_9BACT|nr:DUF502 domain-containing protein [Rufibacter glacialis]KAA6435376.1 DUF502 domain-containing protein [Rufibacter glacialis]GGK62886.1 hypothetical protein GCM10011405_08670 [Rufibacter glacialis]
MKKLLRYFLNGFLIVAPISLTVYIIVAVINWLDDLFWLKFPGVGLLLIVALVTMVGFIGSSFFVKPLLVVTERIMSRLPLVNMIYSSLKDLFDAFVGENKKFNQPVLVKMTQFQDTYKLGFVTQMSMEPLNLPDKVAVYFPHSYNFSGELFLVARENVTYLEIPSSEVMKFVVSGGVSKL